MKSPSLLSLASALCLALLLAPLAVAEEGIKEDFASLSSWEELLFPSIEEHSTYETVKDENGSTKLLAKSKASASGIVMRAHIDITKTPILSWRWRAKNIYQSGNGKLKSGDDYPIRVHVLFAYEPEKASMWTKAKYEAAKLRFGEYPPLATINYVWSNKTHAEEFFKSPYTDSAIIFPVDSGSQHLGKWRVHSTNVWKDYQKAFGEEPPKNARIAIMSDSDNTEESSEAEIDFIEIRSKD